MFEFDLQHCPNCRGELKIIAAIREQAVIEKILSHPGFAGAGTAALASPSPGAASGLTLPNRDRSGNPTPKCTGVDCVRGFTARMAAAW